MPHTNGSYFQKVRSRFFKNYAEFLWAQIFYAVAASGGTVYWQFRKGMISRAAIHDDALTVFMPYVIIALALLGYHLIRSVWLVGKESHDALQETTPISIASTPSQRENPVQTALIERIFRRPSLSVQVNDVKIKPDHLNVEAIGKVVCCGCNVFVMVYLVNGTTVPTTIKSAEMSVTGTGISYRGVATAIKDEFEIVKNLKQTKGAIATVFSNAETMTDLVPLFNTHSFVHSHGTLGWLRFYLEGVLTTDLERLTSGEGITVKVTVVNALGGDNSGVLVGPWNIENVVVKKPECKNQH